MVLGVGVRVWMRLGLLVQCRGELEGLGLQAYIYPKPIDTGPTQRGKGAGKEGISMVKHQNTVE